MIAVQLSNVKLVLGSRTIFENLNWSIQHDQKIGLIGPNGTGKSSLFKLITGEHSLEPGGSVVKARGITTGYLAQQPELDPEKTALETAVLSNPRWLELQRELECAESEMGNPQVYNHPERLARLIEKQQRCLEAYLELGGDQYPGRVKTMLSGLGLDPVDFETPVGRLSGGQKKLVGLACLLLARPDVLLLDEPDNHLDLTGKAYLERLIQEYPGAVVLISHDRYLLDAVVTGIAELEDGRLTTFSGDYSGYIIDKELRLARAEELYKVQQREIARLDQARRRYALWVEFNPGFKNRLHNIEKRIERMEKLDRPVLERRRMDLALTGWRGSTKVLELINVQKSFGDHIVLLQASTLIKHGDRVGLIGPNGSGKSVLFKLILGSLQPDAGEICLGPSVRLGYYAQEHETLDPDQTLIEAVRRGIPAGGSMSEAAAVAFLNRYLFSYSVVTQPIRELSGGERSRLQLALLVLSGANFLLLDEPTNNLDIASAEVLENALQDFEGTVLVISHDRYFLDRTVNRILTIQDGELVEFYGTYSDYAAARARERLG